MIRRLVVLAFFFGFLIGSPAIHAVDDGLIKEERDYLELVMNIFRFHIEALELITREQTKYTDNVVRHSMGIRLTSGLLDHIYPGDDYKGDREWPWKDKKDFQQKVSANRDATRKLESAASQWLRDGDRKKFMQALDNMKESCRNCHGELRDWP